jgi:hypothetical protein
MRRSRIKRTGSFWMDGAALAVEAPILGAIVLYPAF